MLSSAYLFPTFTHIMPEFYNILSILYFFSIMIIFLWNAEMHLLMSFLFPFIKHFSFLSWQNIYAGWRPTHVLNIFKHRKINKNRYKAPKGLRENIIHLSFLILQWKIILLKRISSSVRNKRWIGLDILDTKDIF